VIAFKEKIKDVFDRTKCKHHDDAIVHLPVRTDANDLIAFLRPIVKEYRQTDPHLPELLSRWRIENPTISTGNFQVTTERTATWLDNLVIGRDDRLIFMVIGLDGQPLGHLGFSNFDFASESAEIDSVLRGVKTVMPGLMSFATLTLMNWGYRELDLKTIGLSVYSDNESAVRFYARLGFYESEKKPLYKVMVGDEEKFELAPKDYRGPVEKYYLKMIYKDRSRSC